MPIERIPCPEITDHEKIKSLVRLIVTKNNLHVDKCPVASRRQCLDWNQKLAVELRFQYRIPCKVWQLKKKNTIFPPQHFLVENNYIYYNFVALKNTNLVIDITNQLFNRYFEPIVFTNRDAILQAGWEEEK